MQCVIKKIKQLFEIEKFKLYSSVEIQLLNSKQSQLLCENSLFDVNQNNGGTSTAPQTPSDSPAGANAGGSNGIKLEAKEEEPPSPATGEQPQSPKIVEEKVEVWAGLKV